MTRLIKEELGGNIMTEFVALRPKTYSYLMDDGNSDKKAKGTKKCVKIQRLTFNDYKNCLLNNETILRSQQRFKSEQHNVYPEEINKIAQSSKDCKPLTELQHIHMDTSTGKVCKTKLVK